MGRKRKSHSHLPKYIYIDGPSYIFKPPGRPQTVIGRIDKTPISAVWQWWERERDPERLTLRRLLLMYHDSKKFKRLAERTQRDYLGYFKTIIDTEGEEGRFGDINVEKLNVKIMQAYVLLRDEQGAPVVGNRELSYMQGAFRWALPHVKGVDSNPCVGVIKNPENAAAGRQYVETSRFSEAYKLALTKAAWYIAPMMCIAVACRARRVEILDIRINDLMEDGLFMRRRKGSADNIVGWSDVLLWAIHFALDKHSDVESVFLFHDAHGQPIKEAAFTTAWQRFQADVIKPAGIGRFRFHDLKRKGVSDDLDNWMEGSGHKSAAMGKVYRMKPQKVKPTL